MWELCGVEISAFPLTWHIAYTTACCYRTSRDNIRRSAAGTAAAEQLMTSAVASTISRIR